MAIPHNKKSVKFSLSYDSIEMLKHLYLEDKKVADGRIYESDTLSKIIENAYKKRGSNLDEKSRN